MSQERLRRLVAFEAARLIYAREETQYGRAKIAAVRRLVGGEVQPSDLPCNREIRRCLQTIARSSGAEQERILTEVSHDRALGRPTDARESTVDRFRIMELLLASLENVAQSLDTHPEGDVLYHSLQVFTLARQELPYDEEFLLAALLHDVGKGIDRRDHIAAGLEALAGTISARTAWLIEHHVEALSLRAGTLGARLRHRLEAAEDFEELLLLADCDRQGRQVGMRTPDVREALAYLRGLAEACGEED
jgi:predicted HD phosphohydrolase